MHTEPMRPERAELARRTPTQTAPGAKADLLAEAQAEASRFIERIVALQARYRDGQIHVHLPPRFADPDVQLEKAVARDLPASQAALDAAGNGLFSSLPVAFDPAESVVWYSE
jgi:hypothetical protein